MSLPGAHPWKSVLIAPGAAAHRPRGFSAAGLQFSRDRLGVGGEGFGPLRDGVGGPPLRFAKFSSSHFGQAAGLVTFDLTFRRSRMI